MNTLATQLTLNISNIEQLFAAYMPFIKKGGLFVATDQAYMLGQEVGLLLKLMDEAAGFIVPGKVVWITPPYAQQNRPAGIGVQLQGEQAQGLRDKIERLLAGKLPTDQRTSTL